MRNVCGRAGWGSVIWSLVLGLAYVQGQNPSILQMACSYETTQELKVFISQAQGMFVYVGGCSSTEGEFSGTGVPTPNLVFLTMTGCSILRETTYQVYLTEHRGIVTRSDKVYDFTCIRRTGTVEARVQSFTVTPTADISFSTGSVPTDVYMKLTAGSSDNTGSALTSAPVGTPASLHIWTDDVYTTNPTTGIDIRVATIQVNSGSTSIILTGEDGPGTYPGCKAQSWWPEVVRVGPGYVRVDFQIFLFSPEDPSYSQTFSATIDTCAGTACPPYDCSANAAGGSTSQNGRRRRAMWVEVETTEVHVSTSVKVMSDVASNVTYAETTTSALRVADEADKLGQSGKKLTCEQCPEETAVHAIFGTLTGAILVIMVFNVFLYFRSGGACSSGSCGIYNFENNDNSDQKDNVPVLKQDKALISEQNSGGGKVVITA